MSHYHYDSDGEKHSRECKDKTDHVSTFSNDHGEGFPTSDRYVFVGDGKHYHEGYDPNTYTCYIAGENHRDSDDW